ncbi:MAG: hypothetical protein JWN68_200 [Nocardioides sp.]|jgi:hypothetical protein|uniref:Ig-like domain repeat protein n=1 Tax=Nocardioides sp. TaxID=35761 RepID=UPI002621D877|nr:Ig-like domain repeat protein [Nocardioides sp.]MCW2832247.1 hypothetical protein [Nocardioides sp.]
MRFRPTLTRSAMGRLIVALVLSVVVSLLASSPPAVAAAAVPTNLQASGSPVPTLSWDAQPTSAKYRVQGSEDSTFSSVVFNEETTSNRYTPTRLLRAGTLHWRVQATDPTGTSGWATSSTTIAAPTVPAGVAISSPVGTILPPVSPPIISWKPVAGATSYDVAMDAEGDGIDGDTRTGIRTTSFVWPEPQGVGERTGSEDFYVRVRARFENHLQSAWSTYVKYDVVQLPPVTSASCATTPTNLVCAPSLATPTTPRVSKTVQDVVFDWDPVKGAKQYEIWIALDRDFNNQVEKRIVYSTRYSPTSTYDNGNYFWKVRPYNAAEQPTPWPVLPNEFQRRWPHLPTLVYPPVADTPAVDDDLFFQWTPVKHATRYRLDVGLNSTFTPGTFDTCWTATTTYTPGYKGDDCMPGQGSLTYWRVFAYDLPGPLGTPDTGQPGVESNVSATGRFVYDSGAVQLTAPLDGAPVTVPTMAWEPSLDAERYLVTITNLSTGEVRTKETSALSWTPTDKLSSDSDQADPDKLPDTFSWKVSARDADGGFSPAPIYATRTFVLPESAPAAGAQPLTPKPNAHNTVTSRFPSLSWQPWTNTEAAPVYYLLKVKQAGYVYGTNETDILSTRLNYPAVTDASDFFLSSGTYQWWVEVRSSSTGQYLSEGPESSFTITDMGEVTGQQLALDGMALDAGDTCGRRLVLINKEPVETTICQGLPSTPVLDWAPVAGAGGYMVYLSEDPDFTNLLLNPSNTATQNSRWTPTFKDALVALGDNQSGPAFYWFIRPCVRISPFVNCGPDPSGSEDVGTNAFRKVSPAVQLTEPAAGASFADEVTFVWQDYYDTNQATPAPDGGPRPSHQTAKRYRIQVAPSATITDANAIDNRLVDQATYTNFENTYPEGDLWWRVQAIDARDNRLAWSPTRKIVKATPALNLDPTVAAPIERPTVDPTALPAFGSHISAGPVVFQWSAETFDTTWNIELYKNDDTTFSNVNRVFAETARQAAFASSEPLAASSEPYRWRVQRTDVRGKPGQWSDFGRFWVDPLPVALVQPADGATVDPSGTLFSWESYASTASAQAARYTFDIEPVGGVGANPGPVNTVATSYSHTSSLPSGTYEWSVLALDARGNRLGSSPVRRFSVDGAVRELSPVQIVAPDGSAVGKTLISVDPVWSRPGVVNSYQWLRDGQAIWIATSPTYTLTVEDYTRAISLRVTGKRAGYTDGVSESNVIGATAGGALVPTAQPAISGFAKVGESLHVSSGTWSVSGANYRYQWTRSGVAIPGATGNGYQLKPEDAAKSISATVLASKNGFADGSASAAPVTVAKMISATEATLSATRVSPAQRVKVSMKVTVNGVPGPTGSVKVFDGAKALKTLTLVSTRNGALMWKLPKLKVGKHKIKVVYLGNGSTFGSKSKITKLFVVR